MFEQVCDRGRAGVLNDEPIVEDLAERPAALVLTDDVGGQPPMPAPAGVEIKQAANHARRSARAIRAMQLLLTFRVKSYYDHYTRSGSFQTAPAEGALRLVVRRSRPLADAAAVSAMAQHSYATTPERRRRRVPREVRPSLSNHRSVERGAGGARRHARGRRQPRQGALRSLVPASSHPAVGRKRQVARPATPPAGREVSTRNP
jgi:hypothetical protein